MPCLTDVAFLLPAGLLFAKLGGTKTLFADGDTGWHIRTGEWILQHGRVPTHDLFSYTKPGQAWFAWEWAWDLLFALIHRGFGLAGVGFTTVLLLGTIAVLLYRLVVNACDNEVLSFFVTAFALVRFLDPLAGETPSVFLVVLSKLSPPFAGASARFENCLRRAAADHDPLGEYARSVYDRHCSAAGSGGGEALEALLCAGGDLKTAFLRSRRPADCGGTLFGRNFCQSIYVAFACSRLPISER